MYLDANNLHGWALSQILPVTGSEWVKKLSEYNSNKFKERFIKGCDARQWYCLEIDVEYPTNLFNLHRDLPFLPERKKIKKKE